MTDRPIIFSAPMVNALLEGRKTMTRRVLKPQPKEPCSHVEPFRGTGGGWIAGNNHGEMMRVPYAIGDRLWCREGIKWHSGHGTLHYAADDAQLSVMPPDGYRVTRTHVPSIFMPRWASRLTLTVTDVRVERLQEISEEDARAEGVSVWLATQPETSQEIGDTDSIWAFRGLWNTIHGPDAWDANPWIVALTFTAEQRNIDDGNQRIQDFRQDRLGRWAME